MTNEPALTGDLYHYTSSSVALDSVIPQLRLRLGLAELVNDPRESRPRPPNLLITKDVDRERQVEIQDNAGFLLRRAAKVACFTQDYELPDSVLDPEALRGYAHPALWAHYAENHTGVCLRFDRDVLDKRMKGELASRGLVFAGAVEYVREMFAMTETQAMSVEEVQEFGLDAVVMRYIQRYHRELFFEKHSDWASETEYRWVFVDPRPYGGSAVRRVRQDRPAPRA